MLPPTTRCARSWGRASLGIAGVLACIAVAPAIFYGQGEPAAPPPVIEPSPVPSPAPSPVETEDMPAPATSSGSLIPGLGPDDVRLPDPNLPPPPRPLTPAQNPQQEFNLPNTQEGSSTPPAENALPIAAPSASPKPGMLALANSVQPLVDPLQVTAMEQAQSNAEMLFTGLGNMPRPLDSPYLYADMTPKGGFRRRDLTLNLSVSLGFNYLTSSGDQRGSSDTQFFATISPEIDLTLGEPATGRVLSIQYFGSLVAGDTADRQSLYDQSLAMRGVLTFTKLTLGAGLEFSEYSGGDRDFGGRDVGRFIIGLSLTGNYQYSEKIGFESDLAVPVRLFQNGDDSGGVTSVNFLNYNYSPITTLGVGFAIGGLGVENNQTQVFGQVLGRVVYNRGPLRFNGVVGVEFRDTGGGQETNPIFGIGTDWEFRLGTTLALSAERRVFPSAANSGDNYVSSNVSLSLSQRLGDFMEARATVGYENASYDDASNRRGAGTNRDDNYFVVQGGVVGRFGPRWSASVLLTYGNNSSGGNGVNFFHTLAQITFAY